jgi:hypothetical protein
MAFTVSRTRIAPCMAEFEVTSGTDPTLDPATDGFNTIDSDITYSTDIQLSEFRNHGISFTRGKDIVGQRVAQFNFTTMLQGSGTAGTAIQGIGDVLKACGLNEVIVGATSTTYRPATIAQLTGQSTCGTITIETEHNGIRHKGTGAVGNVVLRGRWGEPTYAVFSLQALYNAPTIGAIASWAVGATGADRARPNLSIGLSINNGGSWTGPTVLSYELDAGSQIERIPDANSATGLKALLFADRNPKFTLSLCLDVDSGATISADDFYTDMIASTTHAVTWAVGASAGNINTFSIPTGQVTNVSQGRQGGYRSLDLTYKVQHATPEQEWSLAQT